MGSESDSKASESSLSMSTSISSASNCCGSCKNDKWFKALSIVVVIALFSYIIVVSILEKSKESMDDNKLAHLEQRLAEVEEFLSHQGYIPHTHLPKSTGADYPNRDTREKRSELPDEFIPPELRPLISEPSTRFPIPPRSTVPPQSASRFVFYNPLRRNLESPSTATTTTTERTTTTTQETFNPPVRYPPSVPDSAPGTIRDGVVNVNDTNHPLDGGDDGVSTKMFIFGGEDKVQASTYTRWGKHTCPNTAVVVYTGYAAGSYPIRGFGGTVDMQCLPLAPTWQPNTETNTITRNLLTAVKFSLGVDNTFPSEAENGVIKCVMCMSERSPTVMIPGTRTCPVGWYTEYSGYLMSSPGITNEYYLSSSGYCVDEKPDYYSGHDDHLNPKLSFLQAGHCYQDKSPCSDYSISKKLACVVCSRDPDIFFRR